MKFLFIAIAALALNACSALGLNTLGIDPERIDTVNKQLAVRIVEADSFTTLTRTLLAQDVITPDQAQLVHDKLSEVHAIAEAASNSIAISGDPFEAETLLDQINSAIGIALDLLNTFAPRDTALYMEKNNDGFISTRNARRGERYKHYTPRLARRHWNSFRDRLA